MCNSKAAKHDELCRRSLKNSILLPLRIFLTWGSLRLLVSLVSQPSCSQNRRLAVKRSVSWLWLAYGLWLYGYHLGITEVPSLFSSESMGKPRNLKQGSTSGDLGTCQDSIYCVLGVLLFLFCKNGILQFEFTKWNWFRYTRKWHVSLLAHSGSKSPFPSVSHCHVYCCILWAKCYLSDLIMPSSLYPRCPLQDQGL